MKNEIEVKEGKNTYLFELNPFEKTDMFTLQDPALYLGDRIKFLLTRKVKKVTLNGELIQDRQSISVGAMSQLVAEYYKGLSEELENLAKNELGTSD